MPDAARITRKEFGQRLARRARRATVAMTPDLADRLWVYFELLFRWNAKINLTSLSVETPDEAIDRLLVEPLMASREVRPEDRKLIDVGSGGGSPAIPLQLAAPHLEMLMVESKARKSAFLREAVRQLNLKASVETARFEELLPRPDLHESFDVLTIRAVKLDARTLGSLQAFVRAYGRLFLFGRGTAQPTWLVPPLRWGHASPLTSGAELAVLEKLRIP